MALIHANNVNVSPDMDQKLSACNSGHTHYTLITFRMVEQNPPSKSAGKLATVASGKQNKFMLLSLG
jgi:hypothetical protein